MKIHQEEDLTRAITEDKIKNATNEQLEKMLSRMSRVAESAQAMARLAMVAVNAIEQELRKRGIGT